MRILGLGLALILLSLAGCSAYGPNKEVPTIEGVPILGPSGGGPGVNK